MDALQFRKEGFLALAFSYDFFWETWAATVLEEDQEGFVVVVLVLVVNQMVTG
jgi:hypothetical protein